MKANELRQQESATLKTTLGELEEKQFKLRMKQGSGQLNANHQLKAVRRDIARVKTIMHEINNTNSKGE